MKTVELSMQKKEQADERETRWKKLTVTQQLKELDSRLGVGVGATKQRARLNLNDFADCFETYDQVKDELETTERELAGVLGVSFREVRRVLLIRTRKGDLKETEQVRRWEERYAAYRSWTDQTRWDEPPPRQVQPRASNTTTSL